MKTTIAHSLSCLSALVVLGLASIIVGCGATAPKGSNNSQPPAPSASGSQPSAGGSSASSGPAAGTGSGSGSSSSSGSSNGGSSGGSDSSSSITGTVVNSQTGAPVNGTVAVALEGANPSDFSIAMQTTADAQGHFRFDNVGPSPRGWGWTIAVSARSSDGTLFAPALLVSHNIANSGGDAIEPGTNAGTISLVASPKGTVHGNMFSQDSAGQSQSVSVVIAPVNVFVLDREFAVPWVDSPPKFTTNDSSCGTQSDACAPYAITLPTANAWVALFDHGGNQFRTSGTGESYSALFSASSIASGTPDCNPSSFEIFFGGFGNTQQITASSQPHFQSCTP
ncbi:MAG TPA: carboxypeptidase-like regulatory domain-containing protein [Terriglobales bacterium]|nr:carboxypeptidase-like regulatory domain-containing protein [Terriglobales bacterium]